MQKFLNSRQAKITLTVIILFAAVIGGILIARPIESKTEKVQPDWSRGIVVGRSPFSQQPALCPSDDGKRIHLAWPDNRASGVGVHYIQLDEHTRRVAELWLGGIQGAPRAAQIVLDQQGRPHVFVLARLPGSQTVQLLHWLVQADGTQSSSPQPVSPPGVDAESYQVVPGRGGDTIEVFWAADPGGDAPGLRYARLDVNGQVLVERQLNERPTVEVLAQVDRQGRVHVAWAEALSSRNWQVLYATFDDDPQPTDGLLVAGQTDAVPTLGLGGERVYVLWGREIRSGLYAGMGFTNYVSFPIGQPEAATQESLFIPASGQPDYVSYTGEYALQTMASAEPSDVRDFTNFLHSPAPVLGQHDEMAMASIAGLAFGFNERIVPVLVMMKKGHVSGYQVIGYTEAFNARPVLAADHVGNLYAAWLTGSTGAGFRVYYTAATAPARASLDAKDLTDYLVGAAIGFWRMFGGLALLPFFPLIIVPALIIVVGYSMFGSETLYERKSYVVFVIACVVYWLSKELLLGSVLADPVVGRELVGWARTIVVWAIQLAIAAVAGWFTWRQLATNRTDSIFWSLLIFVACDMFLTMLVAGPTLALRG